MNEKVNKKLRRSLWIEVDLDRLAKNFTAMKEMIGDIKIMPAVKANGYGHGIIQCCKLLEELGADYLGVGNADEAILLRKNGIHIPILIFESSYIPDAPAIFANYNLMPTIFHIDQARAIAASTAQTIKIFIKIDTGRGRLGVNAEAFPAFYQELKKFPNLKVEGVYSHMCKSVWPDEQEDGAFSYPMWQYERFVKAMEGIGAEAETIPFRQLANTAASIAYPNIRMTGICPGQAMWGYSPLEKREEHPNLQMPMTAMKSRLVHVNEVIGGKFGPGFDPVRLKSPKRIGIVVGGISDGISPKHARNGYVLIHGKRVPIASAICLEHMIVDLTDCPEAAPGDEVVIFGKQGGEEISISSLLRDWDKTLVEFWTSFTPHISRVYIKSGKPHSMTYGDHLISLEEANI